MNGISPSFHTHPPRFLSPRKPCSLVSVLKGAFLALVYFAKKASGDFADELNNRVVLSHHSPNLCRRPINELLLERKNPNPDKFCQDFSYTDYRRFNPLAAYGQSLSQERKLPIALVALSSHRLKPDFDRYFFKNLHPFYRIRAFEFSLFKTVCDEIQSASRFGEVQVVVIHSHGQPQSIDLEKPISYKNSKEIRECFEKTHKRAVIVLYSCSTGEGPYPIAKHVADITKRSVYAPQGVFYTQNGVKVLGVYPLKLSFPDQFYPEENLGAFFRPEASNSTKTSANVLLMETMRQNFEKLIVAFRRREFTLAKKIINENSLLKTARGVALYWAANAGKLELVQLILSKGPVWARYYGLAIVEASKGKSHEVVVKYLLNTWKLSPAWRGTCVGTAAKHGHTGIIRALIQGGAIWDREMALALVNAIRSFHSSNVFPELFFARKTPPEHFVRIALCQAVAQGDSKAVKSLLTYVNVNRKTRNILARLASCLHRPSIENLF